MPYHEASYAEVLRWLESTEIKYVPEGKKAGTKSYDRYVKYSQAKTVAEALDLGSLPLDLVNDFERHILKRTGGPVREKPLDILEVKDATTLSKTDLILARWGCQLLRKKAEKQGPPREGTEDKDNEMRGEADQKGVDVSEKVKQQREACRKARLSAKFGVKVEDMSTGTGWAESPSMVASRSRANVEAANILEAAAAEVRNITDDEVLRVLRLWVVRRNGDRKIVIPEGMSWVHSENVGLLHCGGGRLIATLHTKQYPKVMTLFAQWMKDQQPEFPFTSIFINAAYAAKRHRDHMTAGPTVVKAFGDFTGGNLRYWPNDDRSRSLEALREEDAVTLDVHSKPQLIDGKRAHAVEAYVGGERFSLVFFTPQYFWRAAAEVREQLVHIGFPFPDEEAMEYAKSLLPKAVGYGGLAEKSRTEKPKRAEKGASGAAREALPKSKKTTALIARMRAWQTKDKPEAVGSTVRAVKILSKAKTSVPGGLFSRFLKRIKAQAPRAPAPRVAAGAAQASPTAPALGGVATGAAQASPEAVAPALGGLLARVQAKRALKQVGSPGADAKQPAALDDEARDIQTPARKRPRSAPPSIIARKSGAKVRAPGKAQEPPAASVSLLGAFKAAAPAAEAPPDGPLKFKAATMEVKPQEQALAPSWAGLVGSTGGCHSFLDFANVLSCCADEPAEAVTTLGDYFRSITGADGAREEVLRAAFAVMGPAGAVPAKALAAAITEAFGVPCPPGCSGEVLAAKALEGRQRKRSLCQLPPLPLGEVAETLSACCGRGEEVTQVAVERMAQLLANSQADGMEVFFLVRALQGRLGPSREVGHAAIARLLVQTGRV